MRLAAEVFGTQNIERVAAGLSQEMPPKFFLYETMDQLRHTDLSYNQSQILQWLRDGC